MSTEAWASPAWSAMSARERDALVAEHVMELPLTAHLQETYYLHEQPRAAVREIPHFSTEIAAAWPVVEKMTADGWEVVIDAQVRLYWVAVDKDGKSGRGKTGTAPEAICLAALRAKGVEV